MRDTLIQHNGFSGQAIHAEDGKPERIIRINDWVGTFAFTCAQTDQRMSVQVDRLDASTRRVSAGDLVLQVSDAPANLKSEATDIDTTGVGIWLSAFAMIPWMRGPGASAINGRHVAEFGSGVGLVGLAAAAGPLTPASITLTDNVPELLDLMRANAARNRASLTREPAVRLLDWSELEANGHSACADGANDGPCGSGPGACGEGEKFDTIIASDCVYMATAPAFLAAVFRHLKDGGDLIMINATEKSRPGIDAVVYALQEKGDVDFQTIALAMEPGGYIKHFALVHMTNFSTGSQEVEGVKGGGIQEGDGEKLGPTDRLGGGGGEDGEDGEGGGGGGRGGQKAQGHSDMFEESMVDEFAGMWEDSD
jgi:SAM-dependent methyltransferase